MFITNIVHTMFFAFLLAIFFSFAISQRPVYFDPTDEEIERAVVVRPLKSFGDQFRKEKSIRLLVLGGSISYSDPGQKGYVSLLHNYLTNISSTSYALNGAAYGEGPNHFIGKKFDFESWETNKWPNLVLLEFSINCGYGLSWDAPQSYEKLVRSIKYKWRLHNVSIPDFLLLEMNTISWMYSRSEPLNTTQSRYKFIETLGRDKQNGGFNRGCPLCESIQSFAKFYHYPVISYRDVTFPAFIRYYLNETRYAFHHPWAYTNDGTHLTIYGHRFVSDKLLIPFLHDESKRSSSNNTILNNNVELSIYPYDMPMFMPELVLFEVNSWTSWSVVKNTLQNITVRNKETGTGAGTGTEKNWKFMHMLKRDNVNDTHLCYGSNHKHSIGTFEITLTDDCNSINTNNIHCSIQLSSIHSWNTSYIGNMQCNISASLPNNMHTLLNTVTIYGNQDVTKDSKIQSTVPLEVELINNITQGRYVIQCQNLDNRHSCITAIRINSALMV